MNRLRTGLLGLFLSALVGPVIAAPKPVDWTHVSSRGFAVQQTSGKYILLKRLHVLRALDARTGKLKFETELRDELHGRAALIGKYMLRYELDQVVIHDIERGKVLQTFQKVEEFYPGDKYYFVQLSSKARAGYQPPHRKVMQNLKGLWPRMRGRTAEERARQQRIKVGQMMVYGDVGLTSLRCFDPKKGSVKWTIDLGFKSWKSRGAGKKTQRKHYNRLIALSGGTQGLLARVKTWLSNPERPLPKVPHGSTLKAEQAKHGAAEAAREGELLVFIAPRTGRKSPAVTVDRRASDGADPPTTQWITDGKKAYLVVRWKHKTLPKYRFRIYTTHGTLKHSLPPTAHDTVAFGKPGQLLLTSSADRSLLAVRPSGRAFREVWSGAGPLLDRSYAKPGYLRIDEKGLSRLDRLSGKIEKTLRLPGEKWSVAFREDKRLILLPKQAGDLLVVNALKLQITARFSLPGGVKRHIWLEDGRLLLVGSSGELWRVSIK